MASEVRIPGLGMGMTEGTLVSWLKDEGAEIQVGDHLYELEGDKAVQEIEATASGRLRHVGQPGRTYPVGEVIGIIE